MTLLFNAGMLGLDSFVASLAVSPLLQKTRHRWLLAGLMGACDGLAVLAGFVLNLSGRGAAFTHAATLLLLLTWGAYCLVGSFWRIFRACPRLVFLLPVLLSLDNFAYGVAARNAQSGALTLAVTAGLSSFLLAACGLFSGGMVRYSRAVHAERAAGLALVTASLILFFT